MHALNFRLHIAHQRIHQQKELKIVYFPFEKSIIFQCSLHKEAPSAEQEVKVTSAKKGKVTCAQIIFSSHYLGLILTQMCQCFFLPSCKEEN